MPPPAAPDPRLLGDFFVSGDVTLGTLAEIYGVEVAAQDHATSLADYFAEQFSHPPEVGESLPLGAIQLVAFKVKDGNVTTVGLCLADPDPAPEQKKGVVGRIKKALRRTPASS